MIIRSPYGCHFWTIAWSTSSDNLLITLVGLSSNRYYQTIALLFHSNHQHLVMLSSTDNLFNNIDECNCLYNWCMLLTHVIAYVDDVHHQHMPLYLKPKYNFISCHNLYKSLFYYKKMQILDGLQRQKNFGWIFDRFYRWKKLRQFFWLKNNNAPISRKFVDIFYGQAHHKTKIKEGNSPSPPHLAKTEGGVYGICMFVRPWHTIWSFIGHFLTIFLIELKVYLNIFLLE